MTASSQPAVGGDARRGKYGAGMTSILVVEDDEAIRERRTSGAHRAWARGGDRGHRHGRPRAGAGATARSWCCSTSACPDVDGLALISMIRAASQVPIIVITARDDDPTMVKALDSGADDYVVKPFGTDQLAARIRAVLRRAGGDPGGGRRAGPGRRAGHRRATRAPPPSTGAPLELARKEFDLLLALASRPGEVVTKRELLADVWQQAYGGSERSVDVHLSWLRRKLGESAAEPRYLHVVRGVGVRLVDPEAARRTDAPPDLMAGPGHDVDRSSSSFVIPLCLLVRTLAEDRAMAAADQEARNVAILVAGQVDDADAHRRRGQPQRATATTRSPGAHRRRPGHRVGVDRRRDAGGPPGAATARRSPWSTTTAAGCCSRW